MKQGCLLSPLIFSLLISEVAEYVRNNGKRGIQLLPSLQNIFLSLFEDDSFLISSTPSCLEKKEKKDKQSRKSMQLSGLTVNLDKTKVIIFRKGGHTGSGGNGFLME